MTDRYDAVIVGAGPYGLSTAAHLAAKGLRVAIQGKPLAMWRDRMPSGMLLRSHWWATNLSDPRGEFSFTRFFQRSGHGPTYPLPLSVFIEYGMWFQEHAVPQLDETPVMTVAAEARGFHVTLADGREIEARSVVMATGLTAYAHRPPEFDHLPASRLSHSSEHGDFARFAGKRVVVVGGGQSAVEYAALLHEAGAIVHLVSRRPLWWLAPDRMLERSWMQRLRAPSASIAPGWKNWGLDHLPYSFYRLSQARKDAWNANYRSGASDWLRTRVLGQIRIHDGHTVVNCQERARESGNGLTVSISDGSDVAADHVMLATGFRANLDRLGLLDDQLRARVQAVAGVPILNHWFESTSPGLYFVGFTSIRQFGPLYRFVAGAGAAARRVARRAERGTSDLVRMPVYVPASYTVSVQGAVSRR